MKKALVVVMLLVIMGIQSVPSASACWYKCTFVKRSNGCVVVYYKTGGLMDKYMRGWCPRGVKQ